MPYTIKTQQIAVKDPDTGEYIGVDVLTEQTAEGLLNEIEVHGQRQKTEITSLGDTKKQAITDEGDACITAINTKSQEVLDSIPDYTHYFNIIDAMSHGGFIYNTNSGSIANFDDGADGMLIKSLTVNLQPRFDAGHTSCVISHSDADTTNPDTLTIDWTNTVGPIPAGTLDVIGGKLNASYKKIVIDQNITGVITSKGRFYISFPDLVHRLNYIGSIFCDRLTTAQTHENMDTNAITGYDDHDGRYPNDNWLYWTVEGIKYVDDLKAWLADNPLTIVYATNSPQSHQLTPQQISCLLGVNNIWADSGDVTVTYPVDTKTYIDRKIQEVLDSLSGS